MATRKSNTIIITLIVLVITVTFLIFLVPNANKQRSPKGNMEIRFYEGGYYSKHVDYTFCINQYDSIDEMVFLLVFDGRQFSIEYMNETLTSKNFGDIKAYDAIEVTLFSEVVGTKVFVVGFKRCGALET